MELCRCNRPGLSGDRRVSRACAHCGLVSALRCRSSAAAQNCPNAATYDAPRIESGPLKGLLKDHYQVIYADPAWIFETYSKEGKDRSPEAHYDCMSIEDIKALPVKEIAAPNAVLLMWCIDTHIPYLCDVMDAWGFTFKTRGFEWIKLNKRAEEKKLLAGDPAAYFTGMGHWSRANGEDCWLGTTGRPKRMSGGVRRLTVTPVREHSRKPDEMYDKIEELVQGPYVDLFSRAGHRPGWDRVGNQLGKFEEGHGDLERVHLVEALKQDLL